MRLPPSFLVLALLAALPARPEPLRVSVQMAQPAPGGKPVPITLTLEPQGKAGGEPIEVPLKAPGEWLFQVPAGTTWVVRAGADGYWCEEKIATLKGAGEETLPLRLLRTGLLKARVTTEPPQAGPANLDIRFQPAPGFRMEGLTQASLPCPVREGTLQCEVPAGRLDLRLRGEGHVPVHVWDVAVEPGGTRDLGMLVMRRGASVAGWLVTEEGLPPAAPVRVKLLPETLGIPALRSDHERLRALSHEARTDARGFFQFPGIQPGSYALHVDAPGFAEVRLAPVTVKEGLQSELLEPLVLARPAELVVELDPPVDPYGLPWRVELRQERDPGEPTSGIWRGAASPEGVWKQAGLSPGAYTLAVLGDLEARWIWHPFRFERNQVPLRIEIPVVPVEGRVTLGDEPLAATLWFGGKFGTRRVRFDSDERGRFEGFLPEEGSWDVDVIAEAEDVQRSFGAVEVDVPKGKSRARVELRVPNTLLAGETVDESGRQVPGARIEVLGSGGASVVADEAGEFEIRGLEPGKIGIEAADGNRSSGTVEVLLDEERPPPPLRLVLRAETELRGRVVSPSGPVPGAEIIAIPSVDQVAFASAVTAVTEADGGFTLRFPTTVRGCTVHVFPPGFAMRLLPVTVVEGAQPLEIRVDRYGGTLSVELPDAQAGGGQPLIVHEGVFTPLPLLIRWARLQRIPQQPGRLVVPNVEPGEYGLCRPEASPELRSTGQAPRDGRCVQGVLAPADELVLRLPS